MGISRSGPFAFPGQIVPSLERLHQELLSERCLEGLAANPWARRAAYYLGELNAIHPFREGNGRTQREFLRQLAKRGGYQLDWSPISRAQMYAASPISFLKGDNSGFEQILRSALGG